MKARLNMVLVLGALFSSISIFSMAPVWEGSTFTQFFTSRFPANDGRSFPKLENYLDKSCEQLTNRHSKDEFIIYFSEITSELDRNFCNLVKDENTEDADISQSSRNSIGSGTFSKLVEEHFNEFLYYKKLSFYQELPCHKMTDEKSKDEFIQYFVKKLKDENISLCQNLGVLPMDSDVATAERPIGEGTLSKLIESHFEDYFFNHRN